MLTTGRWACVSFLTSRELWVGVNWSKSLNQVNKPWLNKEAWYSFFTFSTQWRPCQDSVGNHGQTNCRSWEKIEDAEFLFEEDRCLKEKWTNGLWETQSFRWDPHDNSSRVKRNPLRNRSLRTATTMRQYKNGPTESNKLLTKDMPVYANWQYELSKST